MYHSCDASLARCFLTIDPSVRDSLPSRINFSRNAFFHAFFVFFCDSKSEFSAIERLADFISFQTGSRRFHESRRMLRMLLLAPRSVVVICA